MGAPGGPHTGQRRRVLGTLRRPPLPGPESPQVASGREGVTAVARPPLRENAASRALHQPRGRAGGRRSPARRRGLHPAGEPREPERGWRSRFGGDRSLRPSRPRGPGQSGALPRHLETSQVAPRRRVGAALLRAPPRKFARAGEGALTSSGAAGGRSSASGPSSSMRSASAPAATAGPGLGCSPMPARGPGAAGGCGFVPGARLTLRRGGRAAPATRCAPRRPRARPRPHGPAPPPRDPERPPLGRQTSPRPPPPASARPPRRLRSEGALGPAQPAAPRAPSPFPAAPALRPSLLLPTDSSRAARRRGRGCSGTAVAHPLPRTPPPRGPVG